MWRGIKTCYGRVLLLAEFIHSILKCTITTALSGKKSYFEFRFVLKI